MTEYNPRDTMARRTLARALRNKLAASGFEQVTVPGTKEEVFARDVDGKPGIRVLVYTTIERDMTRRVAKDAIRVVAVYKAKDGRERGIAKAEKRVNRVGKVEAIVERTHQRMRDVYDAARTPCTCTDCGAPQFKSKRGNLVCADLCWKDRPQQSYQRPAAPQPRLSHRPRINSVTGTADIDFDINAVEAAMPW